MKLLKKCAPISSLRLFALMLLATNAQATPLRVTKGDAEAIFQTSSGAGWALQIHSDQLQGAPSDFLTDSLARISLQSTSSRLHYCELDWHVISVLINEGNLEGESRTNAELFDALSDRNVTFELDGEILTTERTEPKRSLIPSRGFVEAYYVAIGRVMAPEDIAIGQHTIQLTGFRGQNPPVNLGTFTFFIDGPGTAICSGEVDSFMFREVQ